MVAECENTQPANERPGARKPAARKRSGEAGFTLVEIMIVMVIISLLATAVVLNLGGVLPDAQAKKARADISTIDMALELYRLDMYDYPDESYGLRALTEVPAGAPNEQNYSKDGYIKGGLPNDPWGRPYVYRYPGEYGVYDIMSYGADGAPGGEGRDADITNWNK